MTFNTEYIALTGTLLHMFLYSTLVFIMFIEYKCIDV